MSRDEGVINCFYTQLLYLKKKIFSKGDMNEAIACYIKSLSLDPRNVNANHNLLVKNKTNYRFAMIT